MIEEVVIKGYDVGNALQISFPLSSDGLKEIERVRSSGNSYFAIIVANEGNRIWVGETFSGDKVDNQISFGARELKLKSDDRYQVYLTKAGEWKK